MLDDLHLELNEGPSNFDTRHNFVVSGRAVVPRTGGLNVSWVARALSGSPFTPDQQPTSIPIATARSPSRWPAGTYSGSRRPDAYTVENYKRERNGAYGPGFFNARRAGRATRFRLGTRRVEIVADIFNLTQPHELRQPDRQPGVARSSCCCGLQHQLRAAEGAARRPLRVLIASPTPEWLRNHSGVVEDG